MPGREAFQLRPALPGGGEGAFVAAGFEFGSGERHFRPGAGRFGGVQARRFEGVFVEIEDGGGAVERKAQHLAVGCGVVAGDGGHIGGRVKLLPCILHDLCNRNDSAFAGHHGGGSHFKHLQNVRGVTSTEGSNSGGHGLVVGAFEGRDDFVFFLAGVEVFGQVVDPFAVDSGHGMPPLDFGLRLRRHGTQAEK